MSSRIEQIIDEIEDYIESCKYSTFSSTKILVNKDEIDDLLRDLRNKTPDEIKRYQKIISNKEAIMEDARQKADSIVKQAQAYTDQMVNEHTIMQQAYEQAGDVVNKARQQAQEMLDNATARANEIQLSAMQYTDSSLASIQEILNRTITDLQLHYNETINSLTSILNVVNRNRAELQPDTDIARNELIADQAEAERAEAERMRQLQLEQEAALREPVQQIEFPEEDLEDDI